MHEADGTIIHLTPIDDERLIGVAMRTAIPTTVPLHRAEWRLLIELELPIDLLAERDPLKSYGCQKKAIGIMDPDTSAFIGILKSTLSSDRSEAIFCSMLKPIRRIPVGAS